MLKESKIVHQRELQHEKLSFVSAMKGKQGTVSAMPTLPMLLMSLLCLVVPGY